MSNSNKRPRDPEQDAQMIKNQTFQNIKQHLNHMKLKLQLSFDQNKKTEPKLKQQHKRNSSDQQESQPNQERQENHRRLQKREFILAKNLRDEMLNNEAIFKHQINGRQFYFPNAQLYRAQKKFIKHIFKCLDKKGTDAMLESSTGTGKTLSLLVSTLSWADDFYYKSDDKFGPKTKIIYLSRAHSQLSQISKELLKTPYRPHMILYGAREKLCINKKVLKALEVSDGNHEENYNKWLDYCSLAVKSRKTQLKMGQKNYAQFYKQDSEAREQILRRAEFSSSDKKEKYQEERKQLSHQLKCQHYNDWQQGGPDHQFFNNSVKRKVVNHGILKELAASSEPSVCPYFYPRRVRNWASLILMPYNYLLDHRTLDNAERLVKDSIIIFDQGHNVASTACSGYDIKFSVETIEEARSNAKGENPFKKDPKALEGKYFDAEDAEMQDVIKVEILTKEEENYKNKNNGNKMKKPTQKQFEAALKWVTEVLQSQAKNFKSIFESGENQWLEQVEDGKKTSYWSRNREIHTMKVAKIKQIIERIFYSVKLDHFKHCSSLEKKIQLTITNLELVIEYYKDLQLFYWKISKLLSFYNRILKVITDDEEYRNKFFFWFIQYRRFDRDQFQYFYKGQILINCLTPQFAFKRLKKLEPRSIIVASGTLKPMQAFAQQLGIQFSQLQAGHIIQDDNVKVRILKKGLNGESLKFTSSAFGNSYQPNFENIAVIYRLILKLLPSIPNGVLVILPSTNVLKAFEKVYDDTLSLRNKINPLKKVYFEAQKWESQIKGFNKDAKSQKGAIIFCVCKGKLSEGIDFKDKLCRSVIFVGVPYLPPEGKDVKLDYKDKFLREVQSPFAQDWKYIEVSKSINQAMGRVIRHKRDYGSIIMIDERYDTQGGGMNWMSEKVIENLSSWVTKPWKVTNAESLAVELQQFYKQCEESYPVDQNEKIGDEEDEENVEHEKEFFMNKFNSQF